MDPRGGSGQAVLYTLPPSHYCEAARWALAVAGVKFEEATYMPGLHVFPSPIARLRKRGPPPPADFTGDAASTPLFVGADGEILAHDSWGCVSILGEPAPTPRIKYLLDAVVGPATRTIVYSHLLDADSKEGDATFLGACMAPTVPRWQRLIFSASGFRGVVKGIMYKNMVKGVTYVEEMRKKLREALAELSDEVDKPPYSGPEPTAAAIILAALVAPAVFPPEYGASLFGRNPMPLDKAPLGLVAEVETWRKTKVGAWTLEFYAKHRTQAPAPTMASL